MLHSGIVLLAQLRPEQEQGAAGSFVYIIALGCAALACLFFLVVAIAFACASAVRTSCSALSQRTQSMKMST